ncbi:hypothetical protein OSTOST_04308 [Ostertagia ostertagi]
MGFVGEVQVTVPLYRLWNFRVPGTDGNLRLPLVVRRGGMHISFQLRPAAAYYRDSRRERVGSVLNDLRRNPWNPLTYVKLFKHWDDVLDILSFKFGIHLPTRHYTLLMCAQMPPAQTLSIWADGSTRKRDWRFTEAYEQDLRGSVADVLAWLAPITRSAREFKGWLEDLRTGAHHSGTARMAATAEEGTAAQHAARRRRPLDGLWPQPEPAVQGAPAAAGAGGGVRLPRRPLPALGAARPADAAAQSRGAAAARRGEHAACLAAGALHRDHPRHRAVGGGPARAGPPLPARRAGPGLPALRPCHHDQRVIPA